jgi:hypothetical protein
VPQTIVVEHIHATTAPAGTGTNLKYHNQNTVIFEVQLKADPPALIQGTPTFTLENAVVVTGSVTLAGSNATSGVHLYRFTAAHNNNT